MTQNWTALLFEQEIISREVYRSKPLRYRALCACLAGGCRQTSPGFPTDPDLVSVFGQT